MTLWRSDYNSSSIVCTIREQQTPWRIKVSDTYQFYRALWETGWSDYMTKGWSSAEELIISIIDRAAKGHGHNANAEEKREQVPLDLESSLSLLSFWP